MPEAEKKTHQDLLCSNVLSLEREGALNANNGETVLSFAFFLVLSDFDGIMGPVSSVTEIWQIVSQAVCSFTLLFFSPLFDGMAFKQNLILYLVRGSWKRNR